MLKLVFGVLIALIQPIIVSLIVKPSIAQTVEQQQACVSIYVAPATRVLACTALIEAGRLPNGQPLSPTALAQLHVDRSVGYELMHDFARARDDHKAALSVFPLAQVNIDRFQVEVDWLHYLKEIQDDHDYPNWSSPPSDHFWSADK
jgi:hypothetical protein